MDVRQYELYIAGRFTRGTGDATFDSINPATGQTVATFVDASEADVAAAISAARKAFDSGPWARMAVAERAEKLNRVLNIIESRIPELAQMEYQDNGATVRQATSFMVPGALAFAMGMTDIATSFSFQEGMPVTTGPAPVGPYGAYTLKYEPIGVVGAITPWNGPLILAMWKVWPALLAGNTVVLKPSELAPSTASELAKAFAEADIPPGVLNVVTGGGAVGAALVKSPDVDHVSFTGGTDTGRQIATYAASANLKRLTLELGGKSPAIVLDDVDLDVAVDGVVWSTLFLSGQMCTCASRVLVDNKIYDEFVGRLVDRIGKLVVGPTDDMTTDLGPVVSQRQRDRIERYVQIGISEGAVAALEGGRPSSPELAGGTYLEPTVFVDATPAMTISQEEIFGPVLAVMKTESDDDAVRIANDTPYGLAASIWTSDTRRALTLSDRLRCGTVWINDHNIISPSIPFGGVKMSGLGRENGVSGFKEYLEQKAVYLDLTPSPEQHMWGLVAPR